MSEAPTQLMEHEPFSKDDKGAKENGEGYESPEEDRKLIRKLEALLAKSKKVKSKTDYNWIDNYKLFRGRQWKENRPSYRASEVINLIWQTIQTNVPIAMDVKPRFEYLPQEPQDQEFADLMNDCAEADWEKGNWSYTLTEVLYDKEIYGTGLSSLKFDPKKDVMVYDSADPFYMFPDPTAENFKKRCAYIGYVEPYDVDKIKRIFPDKAECIKADVVNFPSERRVDLSTTKYNSPTTDQYYVEVTGGYDTQQIPEVLVKTFYLEDDEVLECEEVDNETGEAKQIKKLKFPRGRKVMYCNEVILFNDANDYDDDECLFPYQRVINYVLPRSFWGISEIEPIEGMQRTFNKVWSYVLDILYLSGNPIWIVDTTAGIDTQNLTNQPGLIVEKEPNSEVRREPGVQLQPYVLSILDRLKEWFDHMTGSQDVTRGMAPGGVTAASAIADLQNSAQTRFRLKAKNIDAYLQDLGQQYAARVMQFYTAPRVFRLTGNDGANKYFKMHIQEVPDPKIKGAMVKKAMVQRYNENGMINPIPDEYYLRSQLDVRVVTGSALPFSKAEKEKKTLNLFDRGIIDDEEVLKQQEYPNYEAVLQRNNEKKAQAAQAQAAQKG